MFGYILPDKPEMKIKEFELFRAYYCGICKSMGRNSGFGARMSLNYDAVFLGLFLSSMTDASIEIRKEGCIANPIKKKPVVYGSPAMDFAADMNTLLTYYKLLDDIEDEGSIKAAAVYPLFARAREKVRKRYPEMDTRIKRAMEDQKDLEKRKEKSIDIAAEPFAQLLKDLFSRGYGSLVPDAPESALRSLEWMGYNIGKWIYTLDAFDDIEKDLKKKNYNPFILSLEEMGTTGKTGLEIKGEVRESALFILESCLVQVSKAYELLAAKNRPILDNIIYLGMLKKMDEIVQNTCKEGSKE